MLIADAKSGWTGDAKYPTLRLTGHESRRATPGWI